MSEDGYLLVALNTHMPFVHDPTTPNCQEETWLYESITEATLPLIGVFSRLVEEKIDFRITVSLSPCLVAMLSTPLIKERYVHYLEDRIGLAQEEQERVGASSPLYHLAGWYLESFRHARKVFVDDWGKDLTAAFRYLSDSGKVDFLTSGATHAYLPLWELYPRLIDLQIKIGVRYHEHVFGSRPRGFWLPECAFSLGLDELLARNGIRYSYVDSHALLNGHPRPKYGVHAPIHCPAGVAAFARDWMSHDVVWLKDKGYPGDAHYLDYNRDIGYELPLETVGRFTHQEQRVQTGIKYYRNQWVGNSDLYDPSQAFGRCDEHANDFIRRCQRAVRQISPGLGRKPVLVALFDTEHFGHWWREGPIWLDLMIRKMACDQNVVRLVAAPDYLAMYPTNQVIMPNPSSWGYQGFSETWLMGRNHWIYPALYTAADEFEALAQRYPNPPETVRAALNQYLREFLVAQASDWAFILHQETTMAYARRKVEDALENMRLIATQLDQGQVDSELLQRFQARNNLFADIDLLDLY